MTNLYQTQLDYIFNRSITEPEWYFSNDNRDYPFDSSDAVFTFFETLFKNPKQDLAAFSNDQIGLGLNYIFNNSCSNMVYDFRETDVPFVLKIKVLQSLFSIFRDIFELRCEPVISHNSTAKMSHINYICYMFWDITSLTAAGDWSKMEIHEYQTALADVMQQSLQLSNLACVESGLHGLGHMVYGSPKIAVPIIDSYINNGKNKDLRLINYAKSARTGMIQ